MKRSSGQLSLEDILDFGNLIFRFAPTSVSSLPRFFVELFLFCNSPWGYFFADKLIRVECNDALLSALRFNIKHEMYVGERENRTVKSVTMCFAATRQPTFPDCVLLAGQWILLRKRYQFEDTCKST